MASRTLRRRLHHRDVDWGKNDRLEESGSDALNEPLLGKYSYDDGHSEEYGHESQEDVWDDKEKLHWTYLFSNLIAQWAQWIDYWYAIFPCLAFCGANVCQGTAWHGTTVLVHGCDNIGRRYLTLVFSAANIFLGSGSIIGRFLLLPSIIQTGQNNNYPVCLSPLQEERVRDLRRRLEVPFDGSCVEHQDALKQLWSLAYPNREIPPLKSELWKEMGWQGSDPSTDFRGGGFISLENLIFFAKNYPDSFQMLLHKQDGQRAEWEYPFAVAGINISFMLIQMLDLQSGMPTSKAGARFLELLGEDEKAFDNLYCVAFRMMDAQWLAKRASYMEFNEVLKSTRTQLERELALDDVSSIKDLPAYNMLN